MQPSSGSIYSFLLGMVILFSLLGCSTSIPVPDGDWDTSCDSDSDCVVIGDVSGNPCCGGCGEMVLSKQGKMELDQWRKSNCARARCPLYDCYSPKRAIPKCEDGVCTILWQDR